MSKCRDCGRTFSYGDVIIYGALGCYCANRLNCSERENMPNIKITAEVDGKQVPLETVSTETFEAIKALKAIPAVRTGNFPGEPKSRRLFLGISAEFKGAIAECNVGGMVVINIETGEIGKVWEKIQRIPHFEDGDPYENIKPL